MQPLLSLCAGLDSDERHDARLTLEFIIDHIPKGELQASIVTLSAVQRLRAASR